MKIIRKFKVCELFENENTTQYDWVQLIFDENNEKKFLVRWKWTTMRDPRTMYYNTKSDAIAHYNERKKFAIICY